MLCVTALYMHKFTNSTVAKFQGIFYCSDEKSESIEFGQSDKMVGSGVHNDEAHDYSLS